MQVTAEEEMTDLVRCCLPALDEIEAAFVRDCWLREPKVPLRQFSTEWGVSAKAFTELRSRVLRRLRELLASKKVQSVVDIV